MFQSPEIIDLFVFEEYNIFIKPTAEYNLKLMNQNCCGKNGDDASMRKRVLSLILCLFISLTLTSCAIGASDEAKVVINDIKSLKNISLDSYSELVRVNAAYDNLSEEDKNDVRNFDDLQKANEQYNLLKYKNLDERIKTACNDISTHSIEMLEALHQEYLQLSDDGKSHIANYELLESSLEIVNALVFNDKIAEICSEISANTYDALIEKKNEYVNFTLDQQELITNYDLLLTSLEKSKSVKGEAVKDYILNNANGWLTLAKNEYRLYKNIMTDEQLTDSMLAIARWEAVEVAEDFFRWYLKNPNSYTRYSASTTSPTLQENNLYRTKVELKYGATNSFGAMVSDTVALYVYIDVDLNSKSFSFDSTELTAYYAWKVASSS